MADLMTALRNAHRAGDTAAANRIAAMIKEQKSKPEEPIGQTISPEVMGMAKGKTVAEMVELDRKFKELKDLGATAEQAVQGAFAPSKQEQAEFVSGIPGAAPTAISGAIAEPVAGLAGLASTPFVGAEKAADIVGAVQEGITIDPIGERAEGTIQAFGEYMQPLAEAPRGAGEFAQDIGAPPSVAAGVETAVAAIPELFGLKMVGAGGKVSPTRQKIIDKIKAQEPSPELDKIKELVKESPKDNLAVDQIREIVSQADDSNPIIRDIKRDISIGADANPELFVDSVNDAIAKAKESSTDSDIAKYMVKGADGLKADPIGRQAIKQGFDESLVAAVKGASKSDKQKMLKMTDVLERGMRNKRYAVENRPSDIVGDSALERFRAVMRKNREAAEQLKPVAETLKGKRVDFSPAVESFLDDLDGMGIDVVSENGKIKPVFDGSDIEGLDAPEKAISRIINRMNRGGGNIDAYDLHRMKKFIDETVTYGKTAEGLSGTVDQTLKKLRRGLDGVLDSNFPEYDRVNQTYSDTVKALDDFQGAAGKKMDLTGPNADKAVGTLMRRLLSNAQSRVNVADSIYDMERVAKKYGTTFDDDILTQTMFFDALEGQFGSSAPTSFLGSSEKAVATGMDAASGGAGMFRAGMSVAGKVAEKARGVSDENAIKAMRELLTRQ
jgi:hypothetical protein